MIMLFGALKFVFGLIFSFLAACILIYLCVWFVFIVILILLEIVDWIRGVSWDK